MGEERIDCQLQSEVVDLSSPIKQRCWEQREALPEEPRCIVCSRYGEYICDETEDDVCSIECKQATLRKLADSQKHLNSAPRLRLPATDECFYVRDGHRLGEKHVSGSQVESIRRKFNINVKGDLVNEPILAFSSCGLVQRLQDNLGAGAYDIPTPVQMQTIPAALAGKNLLVTADTGSGKTASFLVPLISKCADIRVNKPSAQKWPLALVLAPTRELCIQVEEQAKLLGKGLPFKTALVVGGDAMAGQVYRIQQGIELIIGTPGRLIDLLTKHDFNLDDVHLLVLDEADCMLQKGFRDQVMQIFHALFQPQVLMFSATITEELEKIASLLAKELTYISVGKPSKPNESIKQVVIWVESKRKKQKLYEILTSEQHFKPPALIFVSSRLGADLLSEAITVKTGLKCLSIHGEKEMKERRNTLELFLRGEVPVLVATGILGRGVDLLTVRQVIVFDMPNSMKEYVHQVGRASRLGSEGTAIVFINEEDRRHFRELIEMLKASGAAVPRELINSRYLLGTYQTAQNQKKRKWGS